MDCIPFIKSKIVVYIYNDGDYSPEFDGTS